MTYFKYFHLSSFYILLFTLLTSCSFFKQKQTDTPAARVFEEYLYETDLAGIVPPETSSEDSLALLKNYIQNWIQQTLILNKAKLNLPDEKKDVEKQLNAYRNSLIIFAYEKELIKQKLDTIVNDYEIENYYKQHQNDFLLKDYIVRVIYLKLEKNTPDLKKVKQWYQSDEEEDMLALEEYCHQFAVKFFLDDKEWLYFDDLLKELPTKIYNVEQFLTNNKLIEFEADNYIFLLHLKEYKLKDSVSPLEFEKERIKNIIVNKRKLKLISKMKQDIYQDALVRGYFEVY